MSDTQMMMLLHLRGIDVRPRLRNSGSCFKWSQVAVDLRRFSGTLPG
jgi:hypothetical protein